MNAKEPAILSGLGQKDGLGHVGVNYHKIPLTRLPHTMPSRIGRASLPQVGMSFKVKAFLSCQNTLLTPSGN